ncbi:LacI family DNA-binding transcriptional regulator [Terriglobus aquaticus]|uniref:LacI family DNA-binding transcriptional regulator n=1 Tax=Terriglobus aquaticus TaxID=940139 RepID=A0ABW9KKK4_9BACT|nr:LacI family DNA-binding transcriptional regulator [Terriglobus aquaticus]
MNMREIARRAGVSSATVSRVINGSNAVTAETARRVQVILDEAKFIPNPSATTLKYGRSKTYGLVIPDICNPYFSEFLAAFEAALEQIDHEMLLTSVQDAEGLLRSVRRMLMRQVDGAVLMGSEFETQAIEPLLQRRIPIVTLDRRSTDAGRSDVAIDYESGFTEAVLHLRSLGHDRIGFIGGYPQMQTSKLRVNAFRQALQAADLRYDATLVKPGNYRVPGGEAAMAQLLDLPEPPTAVLHANDLSAFGAMLGAHKRGLQVPRDISLIGTDDVLLSEVMHPPLTTVRIPRKRLAQLCIEALEHTKRQEDGRGAQFSLKTELVVRGTTAPPRQARRSTNKPRVRRAPQ